MEKKGIEYLYFSKQGLSKKHHEVDVTEIFVDGKKVWDKDLKQR